MISVGKRDPSEGGIDLEGWNFGYEGADAGPALLAFVKEVASNVIDGFETTWRDNPPCMHFGANENDVVLLVGLGLDNHGVGPAWKFSLREAIEQVDWSDDEMKEAAQGLRNLADLLERKVTT